MKALTVFETSDSVRHSTRAQAEHHAEQRYGDALCKLARLLSNANGKYTLMLEILDKNHSYMAKILHCHADKEMEASNEDQND